MARFGGIPVEVKKPRFAGTLVQSKVKPLSGKAEELPGYGESGGEKSTNVYDETGEQVFKRGGVENFAAGLNDALYKTAGGFADRAQNVINWGIAGANFLTGQEDLTTNMLRGDPIGGSEWFNKVFQQVGVDDPDKVIATDLVERLSRMAGEGAGYTIGPEMLLGALNRAGVIGDKANAVIGKVFGESKNVPGLIKNAAAGAAAGVGAEAAMEAAPDEMKPLAGVVGGLAGGAGGAVVLETPAAARAAGKVVADFAAPITAGGRERLAGETLREAADSPEGVIAAIDEQPGEVVPGSSPTTFQQTGDMGLGSLERGAVVKDPAVFTQRRADQNSARLAAIEDLQATGSPEAVVRVLRSVIDDIDQTTQLSLDNATTKARGKAEALGPGKTPEVAGDTVRASYETARAAAKARERQLWDAVDPDGTLALPAGSTRNAAARIAKETPSTAKPAEGEEAAIFNVARQLDDVVRVSDLQALQSRLKSAMRQERNTSGESPAWRRMALLNNAVQQDLETAVAQKVGQQAQAVAAGRLAADDTIAARLQREVEAFYAGKASSGEISGAGPQGRPGSGSAGLPSVRRAEVSENGGFPDGAGDPGLSGDGLRPTFDRSALDRLSTARGATKSRVETFDNATLAPIRRRPAEASPYDMPASAVPSRVFFAGPRSYDAIQTFKAAVGDGQGLRSLIDYAVDRLRLTAMKEDGTLDAGKLASWRKAHADALRALPDLDAQLKDVAAATDTMAAAAVARKEALDAAQVGEVGKVLGLEDPEDIVRTVGSIFGKMDSTVRMRQLREKLGDSAEAKEGLRKAVVDYLVDRFVSNTEAGTSGVGTIKADQLQSFVAKNKSTLQAAGFTETELRMMDKVAEDLQRANRSLTAVKLPGGSNTAQDVLAAKGTESNMELLVKAALRGGGGAGSAGFLLGGPLWAGIAGAGGMVVGMLRQRGLTKVDDLIKEALLDPRLAQRLMMKARPKERPAETTSIGQRAVRASVGGSLAGDRGNEARSTSPAKPRGSMHTTVAPDLRR